MNRKHSSLSKRIEFGGTTTRGSYHSHSRRPTQIPPSSIKALPGNEFLDPENTQISSSNVQGNPKPKIPNPTAVIEWLGAKHWRLSTTENTSFSRVSLIRGRRTKALLSSVRLPLHGIWDLVILWTLGFRSWDFWVPQYASVGSGTKKMASLSGGHKTPAMTYFHTFRHYHRPWWLNCRVRNGNECFPTRYSHRSNSQAQFSPYLGRLC